MRAKPGLLLGLLLAAALGTWGCGAPPEPEAAASEPVALATTESALACAVSDITSGEKRCAGNYQYSLECYALKESSVCGVDTGTRMCTAYNYCEHPDFGWTRGKYYEAVERPRFDTSCDTLAQNHLATLTAEQREGVTYTWSYNPPEVLELTGSTGGMEESSRWSGVVVDEDGSIVVPPDDNTAICYITYENHPVMGAGTGPQCGTYQYACSPACVNLQTCFLDGAWVTDARCGTMVGACSPTSLSPVYKECRDASHGEAVDSQCGAGFEGAQAPAGSTPEQTEALAASQWTAAKNLGSPVYDAPITCSDCKGALTLTRLQVNRRVYATAGMVKKDPKLHVLAGSAYYLAKNNPALTQAELTTQLNSIATALGATTLPATEAGGPLVRRVLRTLTDAEPSLSTTSPAGKALRAYSRDLLAAMRQGLSQQRRLAPMMEQVDRYPEAEEFISTAWGQLFDLAQGHTALAAAVNDGGIGAALGVRTTDTVQQMLTVYPVEPLKTFVLSHLEPDGSISASPSELKELANAANGKGIAAAQAYSSSVLQLNDAQDTYVQAKAGQPASLTAMATGDTTPPETPEDAFKKAIADAKERNTNLSTAWKDTKEYVSGTIGLVFDFLPKEDQNVKDLKLVAKAVEQTFDALEKYSGTSVKMAEKLVGLLELGTTAFDAISAAILTGQMVGAILKVWELFSNKPPEQTTDEKILLQVKDLRNIIVGVRDEMRARFDRTDRNIGRVYDEMTRQFALVNWELGTISGDVNALQQSLYEFQGDINRLDRNVYAYLAAEARRDFNLVANNDLEWRLKVTDPSRLHEFTFTRYESAENMFHTWATLHSWDALAAGTESRGFDPEDVLYELTVNPLATNINYLRVAPNAMFSMPLLASRPLSNPLDWVMAAEAWIQLSEEWPDYAISFNPQQRVDIINQGTQLKAGLRQMEQPLLFQNLASYYDARWADLKAAIEAAETNFEKNPLNKLYEVDLWSGADQRPKEHWLAPPSPYAFRRCDSTTTTIKEFKPGVIELPFDVKRWEHPELNAFLLAHNLGLGTLSACIDAGWNIHSYQYTELGTHYTFRLYAVVSVRFNGTTIYTHRFNSSTVERTHFVRPSESNFNPTTYFNTYELVADNWSSLTAQDSVKYFAGTNLRTQVRTQVAAALTSLQKQFYRDVASRVTQAGDPVSQASTNLSGAKLLWESYVAMGLPLSLASDDSLRELIYGEDKVFTGVDLQGSNTLPDDVQDVYTLFGNASAVPATNILTSLDGTVRERSLKLKTAVGNILTRLNSTGDSESGAWVDATLLRLRVTAPAP